MHARYVVGVNRKKKTRGWFFEENSRGTNQTSGGLKNESRVVKGRLCQSSQNIWTGNLCSKDTNLMINRCHRWLNYFSFWNSPQFFLVYYLSDSEHYEDCTNFTMMFCFSHYFFWLWIVELVRSFHVVPLKISNWL